MNFELVEVADGAWAAVAVDERAAVGNAGDRRILVVDCGFVLGTAVSFRAQAA